MNAIPLIVFAAVVIAATILIIAATKPHTIAVERSRLMRAAPNAVFPLVNNFRRWPEWAPQGRGDPTLERTFEGPEEGVGAVSEWKGSRASGAGRMEIRQCVANIRLEIQVDFYKPFRARNINRFSFEQRGDKTNVTWSMQGPNVFPLRVMSVFANTDRILGRHFEDGLLNLEAAAQESFKG